MPTSLNKDFLKIQSLPDDITPSTEVFYIPSTGEVFLDYDDYFERMIQLNSSCWICTITGRNGLTYDEALQSESEAIEQINNFPGFLEAPILFLVYRYTCRARIDELVGDVMSFMRDHYFMDEEIVYRHTPHKRYPARIIGVTYQPPDVIEEQRKSLQNGTSPDKSKSITRKSPTKKENDIAAGMELSPAECFNYTLQILSRDSESNSDSDTDENETSSKSVPSQLYNISHTQIGRGKANYATRARIRLFIRYYTEFYPDQGRLVVKPSAIVDFMLNQLSWDQIFAGQEPKFPHSRSNRKSKLDRSFSAISSPDEELRKKMKHQNNNLLQPSTSSANNYTHNADQNEGRKRPRTSDGVSKAEVRKKRIMEQQAQLEPLFLKAEKAGVEKIERWRQTLQMVSEEDVEALKNAMQAAKEAERRRQLERRRKEREAQLEWRKPRDDLICDDLKPFPNFREFVLPEWVPREYYWDILSISSFFNTFAANIFGDGRNRFSPVEIAIALVSQHVSDNAQFVLLLDSLLDVLSECVTEDEGDAADLNRPDHVGNEANKDFDHSIHGENIRAINKECDRQKKIHGVQVRALDRNYYCITEVVRLTLLTSGFYTQYRRQLRGNMHCYEDAGYQFVRQESEIMDVLEKSSIFALSPAQRLILVHCFIAQLLSHRRFRDPIDQHIDELNELKRKLRHLRSVDQQHEREAKEAHNQLSQHQLQQQQGADAGVIADDSNDRTKKVVLKELLNLRRALIQLNEGRRVQNLDELRERFVDEKNPLPWTQMGSANEVQEFRAAQRNFHGDTVLQLLRQIYELQGRMGMYFLGRDRAFRAYYYMSSMFLIQCPSIEELGHCMEEPTPITKTELTTDQLNKDVEKEEKNMQNGTSNLDKKDDDVNEKIIKKHSLPLENGDIQRDTMTIDQSDVDVMDDGKLNKQQQITSNQLFYFDTLMACTGGEQKGKCPVHCPSENWPKMFYYIEKDAVRKLLDALNGRGFREMELSENVAQFKDIYTAEMQTVLSSSAVAHAKVPICAHQFGFTNTIPRELSKDLEENAKKIGENLWTDVRDRLMDIDELINERRLGSPRCAGGRDQWRKALSENGDTSQLCVGGCVPVMHSNQTGEMVFSLDELADNERKRLSSVQKLGIALLQLAHGIRLECFHALFVHAPKKNNQHSSIKSLPTVAPTYLEWQRSIKHCKSPSALALFETTLEFAVNWDFAAPQTTTTSAAAAPSKVSGRKRTGAATGGINNKWAEHLPAGTSSSARPHRTNVNYHPRAQREVELLVASASHLMVTGTRHRKQVTKFGDCEMDLDKLHFGESDQEEEEEEDEQLESSGNETEEEVPKDDVEEEDEEEEEEQSSDEDGKEDDNDDREEEEEEEEEQDKQVDKAERSKQ